MKAQAPTIRFQDIRAFGDGQRHAFEELVCQLARRNPPVGANHFRRIEGAGGDGGVEGYWLLKRGSKIGYQAKYFLRSGDINWRQIDKSVTQALKNHPELTEYIIALPCDLTESAWTAWEVRRRKWTEEARKARIKITFTPWTKSDVIDRLSRSSAAGLRSYWFGGQEFSQEWFKGHIELAKAALDERYHPEDHVDVSVQSLFEFISRHPNARQKLKDRVREIRKRAFPDSPNVDDVPKAQIGATHAALSKLSAISDQFDAPLWIDWDQAEWVSLAKDAGAKLNDLRRWARTQESKLDGESKLKGAELESARNQFVYFRNELRTIGDAVDAFYRFAQSRALSAESARCAFLSGKAGTGKSHVLAHAADMAIAEGRPVIMVLGQQLRDQPLWPQILDRAGARSTAPEEFLGALDAASEAAGVRGLVLIDAINEGGGAPLWSAELASLLAQIMRYQNLACVFSCRTEYINYAVPQAVLSSIQSFEIRGFETWEEQNNAARVYMDRRGITRPASPWIAPEFVNPLFLRSACSALKQEGRTEFPRGLAGTKAILAFYINSVARHLGAGRNGSDDLIAPTKAALRALAQAMADGRHDHVPRSHAERIIVEKFSPFVAPNGVTWLEILQRNGLLRLDPTPLSGVSDPLVAPFEVVRFSFQRFQDHLIVETLLEGVTDIRAALTEGGALAFLLNKHEFSPNWIGLIEALAIQIPERYRLELVDALPGNADQWWHVRRMQDAFVESIRWRTKDSFSDRTLRLLNALSGAESSRTALLIEVSASIDHPLNADLIHKNLIRHKMAKRDALWTIEISAGALDDEHPIHRLIDWCQRGLGPTVENATLRLCSLVLTWCFTSTNRTLRDRATKALTSLFLHQTELFGPLVSKFAKLDDLYVLERLWAAAYGACCIDPSTKRLKEYAQATFDAIFKPRVPPLDILLRDYARGIIELAIYNNCLPATVDITKCRPPYRSTAPKLNVSKKAVERTAKKAGDNSILFSCEHDDFGHYEIQPALDRFVAVRLTAPPPYTVDERFKNFEKEVIAPDLRRRAQFDALKAAHREINPFAFGQHTKKPDRSEVERRALKFVQCERDLLKSLSLRNRKRYLADAASYFRFNSRRSKSPKQFDLPSVRRWIAKRAYDYGYEKSLFAHEPSRRRDYSRDRPSIERLGKKYQWLALDEFLCGLADNYWMGGLYSDGTRPYNVPPDIGFLRDIDPTVLPEFASKASDHAWALGPNIPVEGVDEKTLKSWPFLKDPGTTFTELIERSDEAGRKWFQLYHQRSARENYEPKPITFEHGMRLQEFRFILNAIVARENLKAIVKEISASRAVDVMRWKPIEETDGAFLWEAPWRDTWHQSQWNRQWPAPERIDINVPVSDYRWEPHLDKSLPEGHSAYLPSPWLAQLLGLSPSRKDATAYEDINGNIVFRSIRGGNEGAAALIDATLFERVLVQHNLACIWLFVAERNVWPGGSNTNAVWRRAEGVAWRERGSFKSVHWAKDTDNSQRVAK